MHFPTRIFWTFMDPLRSLRHNDFSWFTDSFLRTWGSNSLENTKNTEERNYNGQRCTRRNSCAALHKWEYGFESQFHENIINIFKIFAPIFTLIFGATWQSRCFFRAKIFHLPCDGRDCGLGVKLSWIRTDIRLFGGQFPKLWSNRTSQASPMGKC